MPLSHIFSLLFFLASALYFIFGIYILSVNMKSLLNKLFFLSCMALAVWAFCYSIANSAQHYEDVIFWRRLASLGWGTIYSLLLHFFLVLTQKNKILKSKWSYLFLYLPALINLYVFGFSDLARGEYKLIKVSSGWVNTSKDLLSDLYFNCYYIIFTMIGLYLLWDWGKKSKDFILKKQAGFLTIAFVIAAILGTMTDIIINKYTVYKVPQMASVFVLIPMTVIFHAIEQYGLMGLAKNEKTEPGKILSELNLDKFINIMSIVYIIGGMLNFVALYFFDQTHPKLGSVLLFSFFFLCIGIILIVLKKLVIKANLKEYIFIIIMLISLVMITLKFIHTASITVWAAPFIIVMLSVLFNKRSLIFMTGVLILITQMYIWVRVPSALIHVDGSDYLTRIVIFCITLWLAYFVNRAYIKRLQENEAQVRFQKTVSQISREFVKITENNLEEKIYEMLKLSGEFFEADRTIFVSMFGDQKTYEWYTDGLKEAGAAVPKLTGDAFPWWRNEILHTNLVNITDVGSLPPEAGAEKEILQYYNIRSVSSVMVRNKEQILGVLLFTTVKEVNTLGESKEELLEILSNLLSDALAKVEYEKEISFMAYYDALTRLPNHTLFKNRLDQAIYLAQRTETLIGVIFIDLDAFKSINDSLGHLGGDELLKEVSQKLSNCLRKCDTISRFGGDEFLILLTEINDVEDIRKIADKILQAISQPIFVKEQELFVTASLGVAVYPEDGDTTEILIKNADLAMYTAKNKGKNQFALCTQDMKEDVLNKMKLSNSLYRALERDELVLHFQPQVNTKTKKIVGLEALIRWDSPVFGLVPPNVFIPLAEQNGLINSIGQWVLDTACKQNKEWQRLGLPPVRIAVNLSVEQFRDQELIFIIEGILSETGLDAKYLEVEITESIAIEGEEHIIHMLHNLKELGVTISIDDFGTAYSSLSRLKALPVDRIKIDMQFVRGISEGNKDEAIAKTIIQLAKNLELNVIAEGVETQTQFEFFDNYLCDEIQGYFFYKPMPATQIEEILRNQGNS